MSFVDFLRFNWDFNNLEPHPRAPIAVPPRRQRNNRANRRGFPRPEARRAAVPNNFRNRFPVVNAGGANAVAAPPNPAAAGRLNLNRRMRRIDDNSASGESTSASEFRGFDVSSNNLDCTVL
jgi:hypothetical protein